MLRIHCGIQNGQERQVRKILQWSWDKVMRASVLIGQGQGVAEERLKSHLAYHTQHLRERVRCFDRRLVLPLGEEEDVESHLGMPRGRHTGNNLA